MRKKLIAALLAVCMVVTLLPATALAASFDDTDGHWGASAIQRWSDAGVMNGKGDGKFDPDGEMTRAEFAQMLVNLMGYTKKSDTKFNDVGADDWFADAIAKAVAAGVMNGVGEGNMDPYGKITRAQAAVMLCRAFGLKADAVAAGEMDFTDVGDIPSWAEDAMTALYQRGMISGVGDNTLAPTLQINRASVAALADKIVGEYVTEDKEITGEVKGIVLVVKGAKATIKDATLSDPLVVESAEATLTNTKADDVKVSGEKASLAADDKSSVGAVAVGGSESKVDVKGETGKITIENGASGAVVDAPNTVEVVNNSGNVATVNGEEVGSTEPEPDPENPGATTGGDDDKKEEEKLPTVTVHKHVYGTTAAQFDAEYHTYECTETYAKVDPETGNATASQDCKDTKKEKHNFVLVTEDNKSTYGDGNVDKIMCICGLKKPKVDDVQAGTGSSTPGDTGCADGHDWIEDNDPTRASERKELTCTQNGVTTWKCSREGCNFKTTKVTTALGHKLVATVTKNPSCGVEGEKVWSCSVCKAKNNTDSAIGDRSAANYGIPAKEKIAATGNHTYSEWTVTAEATCKAAGTKVAKCTVCKNVGQTVTITKLNHILVTTAGTGENINKHMTKCTLCGKKANGDAAAWETCSEFNYTPGTGANADKHSMTCKACGQVETIVSGGKNVTKYEEHTFAADGNGKCTACGASAGATGACANGHTYTTGGTADAAKTCSVCGAVHNHVWTNGKCSICAFECTHATHGTDGKCTTCGSAVAHNYSTPNLHCACGKLDPSHTKHTYNKNAAGNGDGNVRCVCGAFKQHEHTESQTPTYVDKQAGADCKTKGTATAQYVCTTCGQVLRTERNVAGQGEFGNHSFGDWSDITGKASSTKSCTVCTDTDVSNGNAASGRTVTCDHSGTPDTGWTHQDGGTHTHACTKTDGCGKTLSESCTGSSAVACAKCGHNSD